MEPIPFDVADKLHANRSLKSLGFIRSSLTMADNAPCLGDQQSSCQSPRALFSFDFLNQSVIGCRLSRHSLSVPMTIEVRCDCLVIHVILHVIFDRYCALLTLSPISELV